MGQDDRKENEESLNDELITGLRSIDERFGVTHQETDGTELSELSDRSTELLHALREDRLAIYRDRYPDMTFAVAADTDDQDDIGDGVLMEEVEAAATGDARVFEELQAGIRFRVKIVQSSVDRLSIRNVGEDSIKLRLHVDGRPVLRIRAEAASRTSEKQKSRERLVLSSSTNTRPDKFIVGRNKSRLIDAPGIELQNARLSAHLL